LFKTASTSTFCAAPVVPAAGPGAAGEAGDALPPCAAARFPKIAPMMFPKMLTANLHCPFGAITRLSRTSSIAANAESALTRLVHAGGYSGGRIVTP
jgi:hypothetical protein